MKSLELCTKRPVVYKVYVVNLYAKYMGMFCILQLSILDKLYNYGTRLDL